MSTANIIENKVLRDSPTLLDAGRVHDSWKIINHSYSESKAKSGAHSSVLINKFIEAIVRSGETQSHNDDLNIESAVHSTSEASDHQKTTIRAVNTQSDKQRETSRFAWRDTIQSWVGYITEVNSIKSEFTAIIKDQTNNDNPDEEVVIGIESLMPGDRKLVEVGAVFYWNIGKQQINKSGTVKNASDLRMRRLPNLNKAQFKKAEQFAQKVSTTLNAR